jgi:hypothetical protein
MDLLCSIQNVDTVQGIYLVAKPNLHFWVSGVYKHVKPDITIQDGNELILLVYKDKTYEQSASRTTAYGIGYCYFLVQ